MRAKLNLAVAFLEHEAAGGAVLVVAAVAALLISNSPLSSLYDRILGTPAGVRIGPLALEKPLLLWINDGLMAIFFFLVGLEIKRELLRGELSTFAQAVLPAVAASGGMAVPALVYVAVTAADPATLRGWAIPAATDIAFAVGVLSLMGNRVPHALKMFLLALAIFDDLGSIVIIAAFYTDNLTWTSLALAVVGIVALVFMNVRGVTQPAPYLLTGVYIWVCVLKSGVHATLAGVVVALATPFAGKDPGQPLAARAARGEPAPLDRLWRPAAIRIRQCRRGAQRPWLAEAVGAGGARCAPWPAARQAARHPRRDLPRRGQQNRRQAAREARWDQMVAIALLRGIGFTMSLFIGTLAFGDPLHAAEVRLGVLSGSVFSASLALIVLALTPRLPVAP